MDVSLSIDVSLVLLANECSDVAPSMRSKTMEDLMWLLVQPPEAREAVGFVDYDLMIGLSPRLPHDEAYMRGWNEAKEMASKFSEKGPALLQKDATVSG